jgi:hypothetical protein
MCDRHQRILTQQKPLRALVGPKTMMTSYLDFKEQKFAENSDTYFNSNSMSIMTVKFLFQFFQDSPGLTIRRSVFVASSIRLSARVHVNYGIEFQKARVFLKKFSEERPALRKSRFNLGQRCGTR